ncbi:hypothetical protein JHW43_002724 [Diplocarpon mali]|nr:hypothetical protein JHW43_002724 [Diplocarpon mali]
MKVAVMVSGLAATALGMVVEKRDGTCAHQPAGTGPAMHTYVFPSPAHSRNQPNPAPLPPGHTPLLPQVSPTRPPPSPDTPAAFRASPLFTAAAVSAETPTNFTSVFTTINNSTQQTKYMGSTLLSTYDAAQCASLCQQTTGCAGFNLYFERDPSKDPNSVRCPNPASVTNIKCVVWGVPLTAEGATNSGQRRAGFKVVIAGMLRPSPAPSSSFVGAAARSGAKSDGQAPMDTTSATSGPPLPERLRLPYYRCTERCKGRGKSSPLAVIDRKEPRGGESSGISLEYEK